MSDRPEKTEFEIVLLPGDGIGPEVTEPTVQLLRAAAAIVGGFYLDFTEHQAGAAYYKQHGASLAEGTIDAVRQADATFLGAMGLPDVRYPDGTEISPQIELREVLELYAGVRPVRTIPGLALPLADPRARKLDIVLIRESTEGLFAARGKCEMEDDAVARDTMTITRRNSERLFDFAFDLATHRKRAGHPGHLTCVDKANVLGSFAFFRRIFDERGQAFPEVEARYCYVDAAGLNLVKQPWMFDVIVTENMFGDILSDVGAGLMGGMGFAPSADIGDNDAVFQPCHGSAPDIAGQGKANPVAAMLSGAMMLSWLGTRYANKQCFQAGEMIQRAVDIAFANGDLVPTEIGGDAGTIAIARAVQDALNASANRGLPLK